ncbi:MAG: hypothetical protein ABI597_09510 [Gammaproteobacteria bacterium]
MSESRHRSLNDLFDTPTRSDEPDEKNNHNNASHYAFFKDIELIDRIKNTGMAAGATDAILSTFTDYWPLADNFISNVVPYYVSAFYYIFPCITPFLPNLKNKFFSCAQTKKNPPHHHDEDEHLLDSIRQVDEFNQILLAKPHLIPEILTEIHRHTQEAHSDNLDLFINIIYLLSRAVNGCIITIKAYNVTSSDTNDQLDNWSGFAASVINVVYLSAILFQKYYHNRKSKKSTGHDEIDSEHAANETTLKSPLISIALTKT